jgi:glycosyltransferase involved in cell wall biosynthesis
MADPPLHMLHIETGRYLYGGGLQVIWLLQGLSKLGYRNSLVCARGSAIGQKATSYATVHQIPMQGEMDPRLLFSLLRIIRKERPNLIHVHSRRGADLWGGLAAKLTRTAAIVTRRVDNPEPPVLAHLKYGMFARIITISEAILRVLAAEGIPKDKLICVPSAVDPRPFQHPCEKEWFRKEFKLDAPTRAIGVIAQLISRKGHRDIIDAAPKVLNACPQVRFLFFGQGPLRAHLEQLSTKRGLAGKITFAGFRNDLERILPCLSAVVHPATMEGLGVSLLQAAAAGVPIIATNRGGIPEIVQHGQNGYLLEPGDVNSITDAVVSLLKNQEMAAQFGRSGRKRVEARFSVASMVEGNVSVYHQALGQR